MINFNDQDFLVNPYPDLAKLRSAGKPIWHEETQMFLAAKYDDANAVLRNKSLGRIFKAKVPKRSGQLLTGYTLIQFLIPSHQSTPDYVHWFLKLSIRILLKAREISSIRLLMI